MTPTLCLLERVFPAPIAKLLLVFIYAGLILSIVTLFEVDSVRSVKYLDIR